MNERKVSERSADKLDQASDLQQALNEQARARNDVAMRPQEHKNFNGEDCVECWEPIPAERLAMGKVRCVICQGKIENKHRYFGGA